MNQISRGILVTLLFSSMLMVAFNIQAAVSPEPPETEWEWTYGGVGQDQLSCVIQCSDGGYVLAGSTRSFGAGGLDIWMAKIDSARNIVWSRPYGGAGDDGLGLHGCAKTIDGGYALAGFTESYGAGGRDVWLVKTDADGNMEWDETYGGAGWEEAISLIQTDDQGYTMAGYTESFGAGGADFWLIKTDSSGIEEWNQTYGGAYRDWAFSLIQTSDGGFAMTGWKQSYAGAGPHRGRDAWLVKTDSAGNMEWNQSYGEAGYADDQGYSVTQTDDGGYAIAGHTRSFGATRYDWLLLRTDSSGTLLWHRIYGEAYDDYAHFIQQTDDEGFLIVGDTQVSSVGGSFDGWLMKTDSTGQIQWDKTFGEADVRDGLNRVIETADGGYALAGSKGGPVIGGSGDFDFWLIKLARPPTPELYIRRRGAHGTSGVWPEWHVGLDDWEQTSYSMILNYGEGGAWVEVEFVVYSELTGIEKYRSNQAWVNAATWIDDDIVPGEVTVSVSFTPRIPGKYYVSAILYFKFGGMTEKAPYYLYEETLGGEGLSRDINVAFKVQEHL